MELLYIFLSGMFLVNSLPHLFKGITGQTHMTPYKRVSSPLINVLWAFINIFLGIYFLSLTGYGFAQVLLDLNNMTWSFLLGGLLMAVADAWLFSNSKARFPWHKD